MKGHRVFSSDFVQNIGIPVQVSDIQRTSSRILSQHEKYRKAFGIASLASEIPMNEYHYALECLQKLVEMWENGKHVAVKIIDADQNANIPPCQSQPPVTMDMPSTTSNIHLDAEHHGHTLQLPPLHSQPPVTPDMPPTTSHTPLTHLSPNQSQPSTKSKPLSDSNYEEGVLSTKIQLPPKMIKRGRPKGSDLTVNGLPAKNHRQKETLPAPFIKKSPEKKKKYIVSWIIPTYFGESLLGKKFAVKDLPERATEPVVTKAS